MTETPRSTKSKILLGPLQEELTPEQISEGFLEDIALTVDFFFLIKKNESSYPIDLSLA